MQRRAWAIHHREQRQRSHPGRSDLTPLGTLWLASILPNLTALERLPHFGDGLSGPGSAGAATPHRIRSQRWSASRRCASGSLRRSKRCEPRRGRSACYCQVTSLVELVRASQAAHTADPCTRECVHCCAVTVTDVHLDWETCDRLGWCMPMCSHTLTGGSRWQTTRFQLWCHQQPAA
jgi:hypothetical protein